MSIERREFREEQVGAENPDKEIRRQLELEGWQFIENQRTHTDSRGGVVTPREISSETVIERSCLDRHKNDGLTEIRLVRPHTLQGILGWEEDPFSYDVYMRKPTVG